MESNRKNPDKKTILLVEDEAVIALDRKRLLEKHGYSVIHVLHGEEAVETALEAAADLILMDIDLGKNRMTGPKAAEQILRYRRFPLSSIQAMLRGRWSRK